MRVKDIMTTTVDSIDSTDSIAHAATWMAKNDVGALPVLSHGKLAGIVTDRDIVVRGISAGSSVNEPIETIMTRKVATSAPGDDIHDALRAMQQQKVRRMPVCEDGGKIVGMVTLADLAHRDPDKAEVTQALGKISEPAGAHCQSQLVVETA